MAQTATEAVSNAVVGRSKRRERGGESHMSAPEEHPAIPLDLVPLVSPFKKRGRLAVRVEHMPLLARLSAGRNNGDNSWSLASDELEELTFQPPARFNAPHRLVIRVIVYAGSEASTAAVLDYTVSPGDPVTAPMPPSGANTDNSDDGARGELDRLRGELTHITNLLREREAELAAAREENEVARVEQTLARDAWKKEMDARVAEIEKNAVRHSEESSDLATRRTEAALAKAEEKWKAGEAVRLSAASAQWRKVTDAALAEALAAADRDRMASDTKLRRLMDELAGLRQALSTRDGEISQLRAAVTRAEADASAAADLNRTAGESELRSLKTELADLRQNLSARNAELSQIHAEKRKVEADAAQELAEVRAASRITGAEKQDEIDRLSTEVATLHSRLAERDALVTRLQTSGAEANAHRDDEHRDAIAAAEGRGRAQAARAIVELKARCERAEAEVEAAVARFSADKTEIERLRDDCETLRGSLTGREAELKAARVAKAAPTSRGSAELEAALAEVTERCEAAEAALMEMRKRAAPPGIAETERLRDEVATLEAMLASRDAELARTKVAAEHWYEHQNGGTVADHEPRARRNPRRPNNDNDADAARQRGPMRDVFAVMAVTVAAILFYPQLVAMLPYSWQAELPAFMTDGGASEVAPSSNAPRAGTRSAPPHAPAEQLAVITRGINLRAGPSTKTSVVSTLKAGTEVSRTEKRGGWVQVRVLPQTGGQQALLGWVFSTYLKPADAGETAPPHK